jgi:hypothetical protein
VRSLHRVVFGVSAFLVWGTPLVSPVVRAQSADSPTFHINSQRLQGTLEKLSEFGRNPEGGVTRLGFSETDLAAREYVTGLIRQAGLEGRPRRRFKGRARSARRGAGRRGSSSRHCGIRESHPEPSTLSLAVLNSRSSCATLMPQKLFACGSTFSRDS